MTYRVKYQLSDSPLVRLQTLEVPRFQAKQIQLAGLKPNGNTSFQCELLLYDMGEKPSIVYKN